ncbi:fatty acid-binding protein, heart-like [Argopecten irradians]|uniref:fatty acid-binding protein, heart-like n=1 Tax=Argopecten irradians TaxID=31199 RepID=UPI003710D96A
MSNGFIGTWIGTKKCGESEGFDDYCKEMKTATDIVDGFRAVTLGLTYTQMDDGQIEICVLSDGNNVKTTVFRPGVEYDSEGFDGKMYKILTTIDGNTSKENSIPVEKFHQGTTTMRTIENGTMHVESSSNANPSITMKYTMDRK